MIDFEVPAGSPRVALLLVLARIHRSSKHCVSTRRLPSLKTAATSALLSAVLVLTGAQIAQGAWVKGQSLGPGDNWSEYDRPASTNPTSPSGFQAQPMTLQRYAISTPDWATLRNYPAHYVIALGHNGWGDDVSKKDAGGTWYYGYIDGASDSIVQACAWIEASHLNPAQNAPSFDCSPYPDTRPSSFMAYYDGNIVGANCSASTGKCDGTDAVASVNPSTCGYANGNIYVYSNVQPWAPNINHDGRVAWTIPSGSTVKWRYVTPDGRFALIRDPNSPINNDWGFIGTGCLNQTQPRYAPPSY